jgi:TonB family protein
MKKTSLLAIIVFLFSFTVFSQAKKATKIKGKKARNITRPVVEKSGEEIVVAPCLGEKVKDEVGQGRGEGTGRQLGGGMGQGRGGGSPIVDPVTTPLNDTGISSQSKITKQNEIVKNKELSILQKPRHSYTNEARINNIQGVVELSVTFKADGKVGAIKVIKGLQKGLTQNAANAAGCIKFEPEIKNGKAITVTRILQYRFTLY